MHDHPGEGDDAGDVPAHDGRTMAELTYEVSFKGVASPMLRAAFVDHELEAGAGITTVRCTQAALRTVIARIEEFGLELLEVRLIAAQSANQSFTEESDGS